MLRMTREVYGRLSSMVYVNLVILLRIQGNYYYVILSFSKTIAPNNLKLVYFCTSRKLSVRLSEDISIVYSKRLLYLIYIIYIHVCTHTHTCMF